jgi:hypothetical protein
VYQALTGQHIWIPIGGTVDHGTVLPAGLQVIFDFANFWEGEIAYRPKFDDTRMVLRGVELPPYSHDDGYMGGIKINVMVQRHRLCTLLTTSESACRAIELLYDTFVFAPEATEGKLPVFRIGEPRGYSTKYRPDLIYAPVYIPVGWADRDPSPQAFGARLIPPPQPQPALTYAVATAPASETDKMFDTAHGEVLSPEPASAAKLKAGKRAGKKASSGPQYDADLDDEMPF